MPSWEQVNAVARMQEHLHAHVEDPTYGAESMCAALGYSERHARRLFSALVGQTPGEYLRRMRLTRAAQSLGTTWSDRWAASVPAVTTPRWRTSSRCCRRTFLDRRS